MRKPRGRQKGEKKKEKKKSKKLRVSESYRTVTSSEANFKDF